MHKAPSLILTLSFFLTVAPAPAAERDHRWIGPVQGFELSAADETLSPSALTAADLDGDGLPELVVAYARVEGGRLAVYRSNLDARDPSSFRARARKSEGTFDDSPLLSGAPALNLPVAADLLGGGDLDGDGHVDVVIARRGDRALWWLPGIGAGQLDYPQQLPLRGAITSLITADFDRTDGRVDLVLGLTSDDGAELLLLRRDDDGLFEESRLLAGKVGFDSLAVGHLDRDKTLDLAAAAGGRLTLFLGDGSGRFEGGIRQSETLEDDVRSLTIGNFDDGTRHGPGIALLLDDGSLQMLRVGERPLPIDQLPEGANGADGLIALNISNRPGDDLLLRDAAQPRVLLRVGGLPQGEWIELKTRAIPLAVLPMQLNADPFADIVTSIAGLPAPSLMLTAVSHIHAVDSTADDGDLSIADGICATSTGDCTLRAAIEQANAAAGTDAVRFDIPGGGPHTIQPLAALPAITDPLLLDATTEPDYAGFPVVELDGSLAGETDGLNIVAGSSSVRGLAVNRFAWSGVVFLGSEAIDNLIQACYIGTDPSGATAQPNLGNGVYVVGGARNTRIGTDGDGVADAEEGNLLSGNGANGVAIGGEETEGNVIAGNLIGTDATGTGAIGNGEFGAALVSRTHDNIIGTNGDGLSDVEERNVISGNQVRGVLVAMEAEQSVVAGNYIGTDITGSAPLPNEGGGVELANGASFNLVGTDADGISDDLERNLISGNRQSGLIMFGEPIVEGNTIAGNFIGTDPSGSGSLGNEYEGISASEVLNTTIGGSQPAARNLISANGGNGLSIFGDSATGTLIQGNYIGTDITGSAALGNGSAGVTIGQSPANVIGTDGDGLDDAAEGNLISANGYTGILIYGSGADNNVVSGNLIGTEITGTTALPNSRCGIELSNGPRFNRIGTNDDGQSDTLERNVVSGNAGCGITLFGSPGAEDNLITGNFIGVQTDGVSPLGNTHHGILINADANRNKVGGRTVTPGFCDGPCNVIAYNGIGASLDGVRIAGGVGNAILGNVIYSSNAGSGIDIANASSSPNDHGDIDGGSNNGQNFPMLSTATTTAVTTTIEGTLDSLPSTTFHLEFYANSVCDNSGYGEGESLLGTHTLVTGIDGMASFSVPVSPAVPGGYTVSATATRMAPGDIPTDTSEFSPCIGLGPALGAGRVPDGDSLPGTKMTMVKGSGSNVIFSWDPSCVGSDVDYAVFTGTLGQPNSHVPRICSSGGLTTVTLWLNDTFNHNYFFVVPQSGTRDGSYGVDSENNLRPVGAAVCHERLIEACP